MTGRGGGDTVRKKYFQVQRRIYFEENEQSYSGKRFNENPNSCPSTRLLTDSKSRMPTKLWPRNSPTLFGPNIAVNRLHRVAEAAQYLLGHFKSAPQEHPYTVDDTINTSGDEN